MAVFVVGAALSLPLMPGSGSASAAGTDRDCADFGTQAEAQAFFEASGPGDPHQLDADGDGRACEDLPCPCTSGHGDDGGGTGDGSAGTGSGKHGTVLSIADGDTIEVRMGGRTEDVRLIGIDTPEVYFGEECGGAQASASIERMLTIGDRVRLIRDRSQDNRDRYDRLLRYVERGGRDIGRKQIRLGWAESYVYEAPFDRVGSYDRAESTADNADRGVWRMCNGNFHLPL